MQQQPRGVNRFKFRYHVTGSLGEMRIDRKYCSLNEFLVHANSISELKLSRSKLNRILSGFYINKRENITSKELRASWKLTFTRIEEVRPHLCRYTKTLLLPECE
jgi:hypothetical protein